MALAAKKGKKRRRPSKQTIRQPKEDSNPGLYIPEEILTDLLVRLSVKSLLKFRCVNKFWASLITSPEFIKLQRIKNEKYEHRPRLLLFNSRGHAVSVQTCSLPKKWHENPNLTSIELETRLPKQTFFGKQNRTKMLSCNGLVCIRFPNLLGTTILFNPSTRKSRKLRNTYSRLAHYSLACGFGYDDFTGDYKVIDIFHCPGHLKSAGGLLVKVYSSKTNSWKGIKDYPSYSITDDTDVLINGALHWPNSQVIVSFNMAQETFGKVPLPNCQPGYAYQNLGTFEDCLSLSCGYLSENRSDIWVMKEYGVETSWTKLLSVKYIAQFQPAFVSKGNKILIGNGRKFILFESEDELIKNFKVHELGENGGYPDILPYVESLAPV